MSLRNWAIATWVLSGALLSTCGGITSADAPALRVEVLNNVSPAKSLIIYAELPGGSKPLLGEVSAGATRTLDLAEGEYRLVAGAADGTRIYSVAPGFTRRPAAVGRAEQRRRRCSVTPRPGSRTRRADTRTPVAALPSPAGSPSRSTSTAARTLRPFAPAPASRRCSRRAGNRRRLHEP